ncbi:MAG: 2-oxoglutarate dehydrogenase E1 component [Phycisphaerales bacterium]|nr:2-oxoglutarate dehydrogenase E1 component [Phycisphaerales bacterium]
MSDLPAHPGVDADAEGPTTANTTPSVNGWNGAYIDDLYQQWSASPESVPDQWRSFFEGFDLGYRAPEEGDSDTPGTSRESRVEELVRRYRDVGHLAATLDPLNLVHRSVPELDPSSVGFTEADMDRPVDVGDLPIDGPVSLRSLVDYLRQTWCGTLGAEVSHIRDTTRRNWVQARVEAIGGRPSTPEDVQRRILRELQQATGLERFLMRRYIGKKWFSLEGCESLIPMLNEMLVSASEDDIQEIAFGMAHRGRINVLVNILEKSYDQLFTEFEESWAEDFLGAGGDVKYHRGFSSYVVTDAGKPVYLSMSSNPSHLEWGHPVVLGRLRAKQRLRDDADRRTSLPVLIHGDSSLPGQGITQELANLSKLDSYTVGGSIHIVINNQIAFTASQDEAYSGIYCTDFLRGLDMPVFHVNSQDPEMCVAVMQMAYDYRRTFQDDVVIDLWGFRKFGHNETDEPSFTNPVMYNAVKSTRPILDGYAQALTERGVVGPEESNQTTQRLMELMDEAQKRIKDEPVRPTPMALDDHSTWAGFSPGYDSTPVPTSVPRTRLQQISEALGRVPDGFSIHPKLERILEYRGTAIEKDQPLDWAMGELLALGSLLGEGDDIRFTGEDTRRGTFSHRHAVLRDIETGEEYIPLNHLGEQQGQLCIHNSPVTEGGCIGFEYGYSLGDPKMFVAWEAQFGDFANAGQVYFDQFIASAAKKWARNSGLVCLLPHGYEGMGPEHSSARIERFLQLCADDNMEVVNPTTPAQIFHLFRRQMLRGFRKPLIVFTPKSLLRHPVATSSVADLTDRGFQRVIDDPDVDQSIAPAADIDTVLLCSGKVYYDLLQHREEVGNTTRAVVRMEQLYPFPQDEVKALFTRYPKATFTWVQEEPQNNGAWWFMYDWFRDNFDRPIDYIGRPANDSPAVGSSTAHREEQHAILVRAFRSRTPDASTTATSRGT